MTGKSLERFTIVDGYEHTSAYLGSLRSAADANRDSLGFFAKSVYEEFARGGCLYVLASDRALYAGHLLFSCRYPRAHIVQVFVLPEHRRNGKAGDLVRHLKNSLTRQGFISIYARVAEDLAEANAFWERQHFYVQRVEHGGASRNRQILVRVHELPSPQLFPASGIHRDNPLGLSIPASSDTPLYLVDLNVLFDVMPRRLRHQDVAALFHAERVSACRLAISNEIKDELQRTAQVGRTDPMEAYISMFPSFPLADYSEIDTLLGELAVLVFQGRVLDSSDRSDLRHLATAISHNLAGFITSDDAILDASLQIKTKYGLEVISPAAFRMDGSLAGTNQSFDVLSESTLQLTAVAADEEPAIRAFLLKAGLSGSAIAALWCPTGMQSGSRFAIWKSGVALGYIRWMTRLPGSETTVARVIVDETDVQAHVAGRILLTHLLEQLASCGPRHIELELSTRQSLLRELALGLGFRGTPGQPRMTKLVLGRVLTQETWNLCREELLEKGGLRLPETMPDYRSMDQQITVFTPDGNQAHVALDSLETLLSPALLCLQGRPAIITPIQPRYSEALLGLSKQAPLLPRGNALTYLDRHYVSSPRTLGYFKRGALMFFYESSKKPGGGELIALARVRQAYLRPADDLGAALERSVLTLTNLPDIGKSEIKTITVFDNIFGLPKSVRLTSLRRIGCGRSNDLITTHSISDYQLREILKEAFQSG